MTSTSDNSSTTVIGPVCIDTSTDQCGNTINKVNVNFTPKREAPIDGFINYATLLNIFTYCVMDYINDEKLLLRTISEYPFSSLCNFGFGVGVRMFIYCIGYGFAVECIPFIPSRIKHAVGNSFVGYANYVNYLRMKN